MAKASVETPINTVWAENTPNVQTQTDDMRQKGIEFQSLIVSNQLNSAMKTLSEAMRWAQASGGYWQKGFNYSIGNIVCIIVNTLKPNGFECQWFRCVRDNTNQMPYTGSKVTTQNGVSVFTNIASSRVNTTYWSLCNAWESRMETLIETITTDAWKNLGNVKGTYNLNFGGANNEFNNFYMSLTGATNFGTATFNGAKERSGLLCITGGGTYLNQFFSNAYYSFAIPFTAAPQNSNNLAKIIFPYKLVPSGPAAGIYFTRI